MGDLFNLYPLRESGKDKRMSMLSEFFKVKEIAGVTIQKPPHMSHRVLAMLLVPILIFANKRLGLGFESSELTMIAGAVSAFIIGKSWEDAAKRAAAIAKGG